MAKPQQIKETLKFELIGIALIALGALAWISLTSNKAGTLGSWLALFLRGLAGQGSAVFPVVLALAGLRMMVSRTASGAGSRTYSLLALALVILGYLHLKLPPESYFAAGAKGQGGGVLGGSVAYLLIKAFGMVGSYIILASTALASILVMTNSSLAGITGSSSKKLADLLTRARQDLADFIFEAVDEDDEAGTGESGPDGRSGRTAAQGTSGKQQEISAWETAPRANGKGIIAVARDAADEVMATIHPKINLYPNAWSDYPKEEAQDRASRDGEPVIEHSEEVRRSLEAGNVRQTVNRESANRESANRGTGNPRRAAGTAEEFPEMPEQPPGGYNLPPVALLARPAKPKNVRLNKDITENVRILEETLANFGVKAKVTEVSRGPAITRYEVQPAAGVKVSRIVNLADDLALSMATADVRIEAPIPGKAAVGIEVPNKEISPVYLREIIEAPEFAGAGSKLTVALGKDIAGTPIIADLTRMPHLLIAGSTGSGKSVCMNSLISSILFKASPQEVKFLMIDPKMVELTTYNGIPHLIAPVVTDPKKAASALRWVVHEMENRYSAFAESGVKNLAGFNAQKLKNGEKALPLIVVLIDELADLMMVAPADVEDAICRLAQMARAAGIHLVVATQRPSVDVITGLIKANIPSRIAFAVSSQIDSRTILDMAGAEKLLGKGDMLFFPVGIPKPVRVQGVFVSEKEVEDVVDFLKNQGLPEYAEGVTKAEEARSVREEVHEDDLLPEAAKLMIECGQASISMLQRRFRIGYARAARLMDIMEEKGIVGGYEGSKPRNVLMTLERWEEEFGGQED